MGLYIIIKQCLSWDYSNPSDLQVGINTGKADKVKERGGAMAISVMVRA